MPGVTTSIAFYYVYVLESVKDQRRYIGFTNNIRRRLAEHRNGEVFSTKQRLPAVPIYIEACLNREDACRREGYLKTTRGRRFLAKRLIAYYKNKSKL